MAGLGTYGELPTRSEPGTRPDPALRLGSRPKIAALATVYTTSRMPITSSDGSSTVS